MRGYTKLFGSILTSSLWCEDDVTLRVWIGFLALPDAEGVVHGTAPGLASVFRVPLEGFRAAVARFEAPDPESRTPDHEGRRLEKIPGGWLILNYTAYRNQKTDGGRAPYFREYRQRQKEARAIREEPKEAPEEWTAEGVPDVPGETKRTRKIPKETHPYGPGCCDKPRMFHR